MFTFVIVVKILLATGEARSWRVYSSAQYAPDICAKHAEKLQEEIDAFLHRYRIVKATKLEADCIELNTRPI